MGRHTGPIEIGEPEDRTRVPAGRHTAPVPVQRPAAAPPAAFARQRVEAPLLPPQRHATAPGVDAYSPLRARGTVAALPATGPVPVLAAPSLHTAPAPAQPSPAARRRPLGRVVAVVAGLVVAGSVAAQFTAQRSLAEAPVPLSTSSTAAGSSDPADSTAAADPSGTPSTSAPLPADSGTSPSAGSGGATVSFSPLPSTPGAAPSPTSSKRDEPTASPSAPSAPSQDPGRTAGPTRSASPSSTPSDAPSATPSSAAPSPTATRTTPSPTTEPGPTPTVKPAPTGGSDVVRSLRAAASDVNNRDLTLGAGSWRFDDFRDDLLGVHLQGDLVGAGSDRTTIQMTAGSSSRRSSVPKKDWTTNQLSLVKLSGASRISGFTLRGTEQGHLYNGLRISRSDGTKVSDVRVVAVPGSDDIPPGETFGINDFHTDGSRYQDVEVDGNGIASANFGTNSSANTVIEDSWFHDSGHANGVTFWQTRNVTVRDTRSTGNYDAGFNFERVSGDVLLDHVTIKGNRLSHLRINSDKGSADYRIVDPVFDGPKLKILMTPKYMGSPNLQKRSDVRVIIGGVDRTDDVVQWVTHF